MLVWQYFKSLIRLILGILGTLATSRAFGDTSLKRYGVSAEPDFVRQSISACNPAAFMVIRQITFANINVKPSLSSAMQVFISDGVTSVMTDQEVVDFVSTCCPTVHSKFVRGNCNLYLGNL